MAQSPDVRIVTETALSDYDTALQSELSTTFGARAQTAVTFGDSLIEQGGEIPANPDTRAYSPWTWANMLLGQAFKILGNHGVGGETTTQIRARIGAVVALNPGWVVLLCGTNNMGVAGGVDTAKADITAMIDTFTAAGVKVIIGTIPPRTGENYTGTIKADTFALNLWIRQLPATTTAVVVDYFTAIADAAGNYRATAVGGNPSSDGIHLSAIGGYVLGAALARTLRPILPLAPVPYSEPSPGPNLVAVPRPGLYGAGAPPYNAFGGVGSAGVTWSEPLRPEGGAPWKQLVLPNASVLTMQCNATVDGAALSVGDEVWAAVEYDLTTINAEGNGVAVHIKAWNGSTWTVLRTAFTDWGQPQVPRAGVIRVPECVVPAGATVLAVFIELRGGMTFRFDRFGMYRSAAFPVP